MRKPKRSAMSLNEYRKAIDRLDAQIVRLLSERTHHVLRIGEIKLAGGKEIYAPHRELSVLEKICAMNPGPMKDESLRAIYREIMSGALALQKTLVIAYLGPEATFTHQAAIQRFGASLNYIPQKTIADVFYAVSKHRADYGLVPVENSTEGVVTHTLDMFVESDLKIVSQLVLRIQYCLASHSRLKAVTKLFAHPQALGQCRFWVQQYLAQAEVIESSSNSRAAEQAAAEPTAAAITSSLAAQLYKVPMLEMDIQDSAHNATRFLVLGRQCSPPTGHDRTSLMFSVADKAGALYSSLTPFRRNKINMTKIESRPSKRKAWEYFFFVDCAGHFEDPLVAKALRELQRHCNFVKVLGSYPDVEKPARPASRPENPEEIAGA